MTDRKATMDKLDARVKQTQAEIDALKARSAKDDNDELSLDEEIARLEKKQAELKEKLAELRKTSEAAWEDMKQGAEEAWESLSKSVRQAASRFGG